MPGAAGSSVLAALVVVALVAATGVYALNRPTDCLSLPASHQGRRGQDRSGPQLRRGGLSGRPAAGLRSLVSDGILWVANLDDQTVTWIDPTAGTSGTTAAGGPPISLAAAPGSVAVLDHSARLGGLEWLAPE